MVPAISVVIASFGVREASWAGLRSCLEALAKQDGAESIEVVLCEMPELHGEVPEDIRDLVPGLRVIKCASTDLLARKTWGAQHARAPILAFLDADCLPQADWLRSLLETFQYYPEVAVVSGGATRWLSLWRRKAGTARQSAHNNVAFRREAYLDCPFPERVGISKAVRLQSAALRRARYLLWVEPKMNAVLDRRGGRASVGAQVEYSTAVTR
jgi:hypothetical protein